jgi:hypothetical protein
MGLPTVSGEIHVEQNAGTNAGMCMECAFDRHDFREMIGSPGSDSALPATPLPHAWIDGRTHVLLSSVWTHQKTCAECGLDAPNLYFPTT